MSEIGDNLRRVKDRIEAVASSCGRDASSVRLLAVSKTFPVRIVREAARAGQVLFGENRVQEAEEKIPQLKALDLEWHLVGHLQSNKVRLALAMFDVIQTVDSEKIARRLNRCCESLDRTLKVYLQVNIGEEPQKDGVLPGALDELLDAVDRLSHLRIQGLMAIPPYHEDPEQTRPHFRKVRRLLEQINRDRAQPLRELSLGMSDDYPIAIEEGSTLVRVGTAIFGDRRS